MKRCNFLPLNGLLIDSRSDWRQAVDGKDKEREMSSLQGLSCSGPSKSGPAKILLKTPMPEGKQIGQSEKMAG